MTSKKSPQAAGKGRKPGLPKEMLLDLFRQMLVVYYLEERCKVFVRAGKISRLGACIQPDA